MTILVYLWAIFSGLIYYSQVSHVRKLILFGLWTCLCVYVAMTGSL